MAAASGVARALRTSGSVPWRPGPAARSFARTRCACLRVVRRAACVFHNGFARSQPRVALCAPYASTKRHARDKCRAAPAESVVKHPPRGLPPSAGNPTLIARPHDTAGVARTTSKHLPLDADLDDVLVGGRGVRGLPAPALDEAHARAARAPRVDGEQLVAAGPGGVATGRSRALGADLGDAIVAFDLRRPPIPGGAEAGQAHGVAIADAQADL